ncbi:unnamed protein product [Haemonchus placei]|uniref:MSP domain-containing protein n=1 Tax=Haemonchus placei TaxID=6290 RepID=A0A0N4WSB2_HAEPC|nr:unnamed protein product [Haemonchus placei]
MATADLHPLERWNPGSPLHEFNASLLEDTNQIYFAGPFLPPINLFFVHISGEDKRGYKFQRIAPTAIGTVTASRLRVYMNTTISVVEATVTEIF